MAFAKRKSASKQNLNTEETVRNSRQISGEHGDMLPQSCEVQHPWKKLKGYCFDCNLKLCKSCMKKHRKDKDKKNHKLSKFCKSLADTEENIGTEQMDFEKNRDIFSDTCEQHPKEYLQYFCSACNTTCCHICNNECHKRCDTVDYIPNTVAGFEESKEFDDHYQKISYLCYLLAEDETKNEDNVKVLCKSGDDALKAIQDQRQEINQLFDKLEETVQAQALKEKNLGENKLQKLATQNTNLSTTLRKMKHDLNEKARNGYTCQMFVAVKNSKEILEKMKADVERMMAKNKASRYVYVPDTEILHSLQTIQHFGYITGTKPAKVLYPYSTTTEKGQINMRIGDVINVIEESNEEWWKGELRGRIFEFPVNYVELVTEDEKKKAKVLYPYTAKQRQELDLVEGEIINVIEEGHDGWWKGERLGHIGLFPGSYIKRLTADADTSSDEESSFED